MKRGISILIILILCLFIVSNVSALNFNDLEKLSKSIEGKELTGIAKTVFGNQKINLHITLENKSTLSVGIETTDKFSGIKKEFDKPTLNVYSSEKTIVRIYNSNDPYQEFTNAIQNKEIKYSGVGFFSKMKFGAISLSSKFILKALSQTQNNTNNQTEQNTIETTPYKILYSNTSNYLFVSDWNGSNTVSLGWGVFETWMPNGRQIAHSGIDLINSDGTNKIRLFSGYNFRVSPDGTKIAAFETNPTIKITIYDIPTGQSLILNDSLFVGWFPDSRKILYITMPAGIQDAARDVNYIDLTNENKAKLFSAPAISPKLSPDGTKIIYEGTGEHQGFGYKIYIRDIATGNRSEIGEGYEESWLGNKVMYKDAQRHTYIVDSAGGNKVIINGTEVTPVSNGKIFYYRYTIDRGTFISNIDGTGEIRIGEFASLSMSPDGKKILYRIFGIGADYSYYVMDSDYTDPIFLGNSSTFRNPVWQPLIPN